MVNIDYLYNPEAVREIIYKNYFVDKKLGFSVIKNGMILPQRYTDDNGKRIRNYYGVGGIADSQGKFVTSSFINNSGAGGVYTPSSESIQHSSETVIYLTMFYPVWGHVITDNIRRLWFLNNDVFRNEFKNCPIVYIPWYSGTRTFDDPKMFNARRLLEILGVDVDKVQPITQPTRFDKIILFDDAYVFNS